MEKQEMNGATSALTGDPCKSIGELKILVFLISRAILTLPCPIALAKEKTCTSQWVFGHVTTREETSTGCLANRERLGKISPHYFIEDITLILTSGGTRHA